MSIEKKQIKWIEKIARHALNVLGLSIQINIKLERIGKHFATEDNACEINGNDLYINSDWFDKYWGNTDETEVRLLVYHEMRHIYQRTEVMKMQSGKVTKEPLPIVLKWFSELTHYQRNEGGNTILPYYFQSVEIDAYAFGVYLLNEDVNKGEKLSLDTRSIPDEIDDDIRKRAMVIAQVMNMKH